MKSYNCNYNLHYIHKCNNNCMKLHNNNIIIIAINTILLNINFCREQNVMAINYYRTGE